MRKPKKPALAPDGSSHPWYELARECAMKVVKDACAYPINPFDPPKRYKKSNLVKNTDRRGDDPTAVRPYPEPLYGWSDWQRKGADDRYRFDILPPDWCPLEPAQRRGKIVVV